MLFRSSLIYFLGRLIPGLVNFLALVIFTRLLAPEEYGVYALVIAGITLSNSLLYQWLHLSLIRFYAAYENNEQALLSTIIATFCSLSLVSAIIGLAGWWLSNDLFIGHLWLFGTSILWVHASFSLQLQLFRARLEPKRYGIHRLVKALIGLVTGTILAFYGWGAWGPLCGVFIGALVPMILTLKYHVPCLSWKHVDIAILKEISIYGLPLAITAALGVLISSSDRFLLGWLVGPDVAGIYAAGYDLAVQGITTMMMIVNLAATPLTIRTLEKQGLKAAELQLNNNIVALLTVALPIMVLFILLAGNISYVLLGSEFQESTAQLLPWIAVGGFLAGFKSYYLDLSFQLGKATHKQAWLSLIIVIVNISLNIWLIPEHGALGAAYATVISYSIAAYLSWKIGQRSFHLPFPANDIFKIVIATVFLSISLWPSLGVLSGIALIGQLLLAGTVYSVMVLLLNIASARTRLKKVIMKRP